MIVEIEKAEFKPVTLSMTFETQAELNAFGKLMNNSCVCDSLQNVVGNREAFGDLYRILGDAGATISPELGLDKRE